MRRLEQDSEQTPLPAHAPRSRLPLAPPLTLPFSAHAPVLAPSLARSRLFSAAKCDEWSGQDAPFLVEEGNASAARLPRFASRP